MIYDHPDSKDFDNKTFRKEKSNVHCECGNNKFYLNWLTAPYTGGYGVITCTVCGQTNELIDDYA